MDGRKRCENASVDEKLFIRFQETENGGFRKRISVDRAPVSLVRDENGCFHIRFRWSSVGGRKRCKNGSVDGKLFIRFQETENGGFRKCISVDRALRVHTRKL